MPVDGPWKITLNSPMGKEETTLDLRFEAATLQGTQSGKHGTFPIAEAELAGDVISWSTSIPSPLRIKLEFRGVIKGDEITGKVKLGMFGSYEFSGSRR